MVRVEEVSSATATLMSGRPGRIFSPLGANHKISLTSPTTSAQERQRQQRTNATQNTTHTGKHTHTHTHTHTHIHTYGRAALTHTHPGTSYTHMLSYSILHY